MDEFSEIYNRYFKEVYRYVFSISKSEVIAEEITQETFYKAMQKIDEFQGTCKVQVWLCQIAKNTYYTYCKSQKVRRKWQELSNAEEENLIEHQLINREEALQIHGILHKLEEPYKEVFHLRTFGELSFAQIAELFGKTESWSRVTYYRAKKKIKEELE